MSRKVLLNQTTRIMRGTEHTVPLNARQIGKLVDTHEISTTWILNKNLNDKQVRELVSEITTFCEHYNLTVKLDYPYHLKVTGLSISFNDAFNVQMNQFQKDDHIYHASTIPIKLPNQWLGRVDNIIGLDNSKIAKPHFQKLDKNNLPRAITTFNPLQLATLYNFPQNLDGVGQKVGIIELGGGYVLSDISTYFSNLGITATPNITAVSVDGAVNNPSDTSGANVEVILDIEVIAAIVPKAQILVYFAPNSIQGFYDAINTAINNGCGVISISWGAAERYWSNSSLSSYNNLFQSASTKNVTIFAAAGDNGSSDGASGNNVDFPGSSPYVVSCGGTNLKTADDTTISQETVWNVNSTSSATGGGISNVFSKPSYQSNVTFPLNNRRGVPDISGDADPNTGYVLYSASEGGYIVVGGTSAVSPLWSGLLARINQSLGHNVGFIHPTIYSNPNICRDITQGNNGAFMAGTGWDPCTGHGSPNGQLILNLLAGTNTNTNPPVANFTASPLSGNNPLTVNFTDSSTNTPTSWLWDFGDSTNSIMQSPSHTYSTNGTFTVSLTATNTFGSNTVTKTNYITVSTPPPIPVADFTATPLSGNRPLTVTFTDTSTNSPTSWLWNFGDNTTSTSRNPSHTYSNGGTFTVSLRATNSSGSNTMIKTNYITVSSLLPVVAFTGTPLSGNRPLTVRFTDNSTNSPNRWIWNFGDGTSSSSRNPTKRYSSRRTYTVSLRVYNSNGSNILTKTNYIRVN